MSAIDGRDKQGAWLECPVCDGRVHWVVGLGEARCGSCNSIWNSAGTPEPAPRLERVGALIADAGTRHPARPEGLEPPTY